MPVSGLALAAVLMTAAAAPPRERDPAGDGERGLQPVEARHPAPPVRDPAPPLPRTRTASARRKAAPAPLRVSGIEGVREAIAQRRGAPLLVNFWAVWCEPCVAELPDLATIEMRFSARGVRVLGVSCDLFLEDDTPALRRSVAATLADAGVRYLNILYSGRQDPLIEGFGLPGPIPHSILYDARGRIVRRWTGVLPFDQLGQALGPPPGSRRKDLPP